ncbi:MAG: Ig-like domain-containing protein [Chloroflexota bacterium]|nr:Ig-like domain-containing protein [Chloroflexota bacterium]
MSLPPGVVNTSPRRRDYYEILGLLPQAADADVYSAYWKLSRRYHALASSDLLAASKLKELNDAAEVLVTPALRREYDACRREAATGGLRRQHSFRTALSAVVAQGAIRRSAKRAKRLRLSFITALLVGVTGMASVPLTAGAGAYEPDRIRGASVTSASIVFVGDSITDGAGASAPDSTFVQLLRQRLDYARFAKGPNDYDSVISALGGQFIDLRFSQDIGRQPRSLVVVEVGAHSVVEDNSLSSREFRIGYGLMLDCLQGTGGTIVVSTVPWLGWDQANPLYAHAAERSTIIREEAASRGIPVADLWNALKDRRDLLSPDQFHPNDAGHQLIADLYWDQIKPQLNRPRGEFQDRCDYGGVLALRALHSLAGQDVTSPAASITAPLEGAAVSGRDAAFTASASDAAGVQKVRFWVDDTYQGYDGAAPYATTWDTTAFTNGPHTLKIETIDNASNTSTVTTDVTVTNADSVALAAGVTSPADGATLSGRD